MEKPCYICKEKANIFGTIFNAKRKVECFSCGRYEIIRWLRVKYCKKTFDPKEVSKIQAWIRENQEELIDADKLQDILKH